MTKQDKTSLLKDLCARLPYNPIVHIHSVDCDDYNNYLCEDYLAKMRIHKIIIKPYLRPMSSMTEDEKKEYQYITERWMYDSDYSIADSIDWLNAHHFDYRGLIAKGLALEATEGMYGKEEQQ